MRISFFHALILWAGLSGSILQGGVDVTLPYRAFGEYVSPEGCLSIFRDVDFIRCESGATTLDLPLRIHLSTEKDIPVPFLGKGPDGLVFSVPLLEARAISLTETAIETFSVGGKVRRLFKSEQKPYNYYSNDKEWVGTLQGGRFLMTHQDGDVQEFMDGKLIRLGHKGLSLTWEYQGKKPVAIRDGTGAQRLIIKYDPISQRPTTFIVDRKECLLSYDFETGAFDGYTVSGEAAESYGFETGFSTETGSYTQLNLVEKGSTKLEFSWDARSHFILKDGLGWFYKILPFENASRLPSMSRWKKTGERESYSFDNRRGIRERTASDGTITRIFLSLTPGPTYSVIRKIEKVTNSSTRVVYRAAFNDLGRIIRTIQDGKETSYKYDGSGNRSAAYSEGKLLWKKVYDSEGRVVVQVMGGSIRSTYRYLSGGKIEETRELLFNVGPDGKPLRDRMVFDERMVLLLRQDEGGVVWEYLRNRKNILVEERRNGKLWRKMEYSDEGKLKKKTDFDLNGTAKVSTFDERGQVQDSLSKGEKKES